MGLLVATCIVRPDLLVPAADRAATRAAASGVALAGAVAYARAVRDPLSR